MANRGSVFRTRGRSCGVLVGALAIVLIILGTPRDSSAQGDPHLRVMDRALRAIVELGVERSPTLAALIDEVEGASVVVYVECDMRLPSRILARLNLIASVRGVRYVRVAVDCAVGMRRQASLLAHEIQHALEIAERPDIVDEEAMESFYEEFGFQTSVDGTHRNFETERAISIQRQVHDEMRRVGRTPRETPAPLAENTD